MLYKNERCINTLTFTFYLLGIASAAFSDRAPRDVGGGSHSYNNILFLDTKKLRFITWLTHQQPLKT